MKVAVIGLGSTGLAVAASLASAGHDVWGFERHGRSRAQGSSRGDTRIFRLTPGEGPTYVDLAEDALRRWRLLEQFGGKTLIAARPGYMAGPPESQFVASCLRLSEQYERGYSLLDAAEVSTETQGWVRLPPQWTICRQEECGIIDVPSALEVFANKAASGQARLAWHTHVDTPVGSSRLRIGGEWIAFDRVVVTAGPWMPDAVPETSADLTIERRVLAWFAPMSGVQPPLPMPILCLDDRQGTYGMQAPGGFFKIGVHVLGDANVRPDEVEPVRPTDVEPMVSAVRAYLPYHDAVPIKTDACLYTMTAHSNFLISETESDPHVLCMSCCSGHGFKYAPAFGEIAVNWVAGREDPYLRAFGRQSQQLPSALGLTGVQ